MTFSSFAHMNVSVFVLRLFDSLPKTLFTPEFSFQDSLLKELFYHRKPSDRLRAVGLTINYLEYKAINMPIEIGFRLPVRICQLPDKTGLN
jgi:hypothetical protein